MSTRLLPLLLTGALLLIVTGCDYTAQEGGTVDVRLSSTLSDQTTSFTNARVTVEYAAVVPTHNDPKDKGFRHFPNMLDGPLQVDLTTLNGALDTLLSRTQVLPGEYNELRLVFADSATVQYRDDTGTPTRLQLALSDEGAGTVAIQFSSLALDGGNTRAEIGLDVDLQKSFVREGKEERSYHFRPTVTAASITLNGRKQRSN